MNTLRITIVRGISSVTCLWSVHRFHTCSPLVVYVSAHHVHYQQMHVYGIPMQHMTICSFSAVKCRARLSMHLRLWEGSGWTGCYERLWQTFQRFGMLIRSDVCGGINVSLALYLRMWGLLTGSRNLAGYLLAAAMWWRSWWSGLQGSQFCGGVGECVPHGAHPTSDPYESRIDQNMIGDQGRMGLPKICWCDGIGFLRGNIVYFSTTYEAECIKGDAIRFSESNRCATSNLFAERAVLYTCSA